MVAATARIPPEIEPMLDLVFYEFEWEDLSALLKEKNAL